MKERKQEMCALASWQDPVILAILAVAVLLCVIRTSALIRCLLYLAVLLCVFTCAQPCIVT